MKKAKARTKAAKAVVQKKSSQADDGIDLSDVRKEIAKIVREGAAKMAQAVVDEAMKGEVAPMKYLFEMTGLHPVPGEESEAAPPTDSLARTLLKRLGLPEVPLFVSEKETPIRSGPNEKAAESSAEHEIAHALRSITNAVGEGEEVVAGT